MLRVAVITLSKGGTSYEDRAEATEVVPSASTRDLLFSENRLVYKKCFVDQNII